MAILDCHVRLPEVVGRLVNGLLGDGYATMEALGLACQLVGILMMIVP